mgnify:CR=1 FL=1
MLNYLWSGMILIGVLWGAFHGQLAAVTEGALTSAKEAVTLCITMLGVMTLWTGVLEVGKRAGLIDQLSRRMRPVLRFLFPRLSPESEAAKQISVNMIANILGLGWAATPAGLKAMEELKKVAERQTSEQQTGASRNRQPGNVYLPYYEYLLPPADPHQHDRLSQPVRERKSRGHRWPGAGGDPVVHGGGGDCGKTVGKREMMGLTNPLLSASLYK